MTDRPYRQLRGILTILHLAALPLLVSCAAAVMPRYAIRRAEQMVLVIAERDDSRTAVLRAVERDGTSMRTVFGTPVTIGRNGMGWGRGLHGPSAPRESEPVKREGDGKSPMGVFTLPGATGYDPPGEAPTRLPYRQANGLICVDDPSSPLYNRVTTVDDSGLDTESPPSHERMRRDDDLYRYVVIVGHNTAGTEPGAGSCIFLHLWMDADTPTAGCTAMPGSAMLRLMRWLDPDKRPVLVQLTRDVYERERRAWDLPPLD